MHVARVQRSATLFLLISLRLGRLFNYFDYLKQLREHAPFLEISSGLPWGSRTVISDFMSQILLHLYVFLASRLLEKAWVKSGIIYIPNGRCQIFATSYAKR